MLLEFLLEIDANSDFTEIAPDYVDRSAVIHPSPGGGIQRSSSLGAERPKWENELCRENCAWENVVGIGRRVCLSDGREPEHCSRAGAVADIRRGCILRVLPWKRCSDASAIRTTKLAGMPFNFAWRSNNCLIVDRDLWDLGIFRSERGREVGVP